MILGNRYKAKIVAQEVQVPKGVWAKLRLWAGKKDVPAEMGILFHSTATHNWGMRFDVDVAFLDEKLKVLAIFRGMKPWSGTKPVAGAVFVLKMKAGGLNESVIAVGDQLEWVPKTSDRVAAGAKPPEGF